MSCLWFCESCSCVLTDQVLEFKQEISCACFSEKSCLKLWLMHLIFCDCVADVFWILKTHSIFIEFYFFIILFFVVIICLFTSYFFRCIIILIAVRKNDIHLIQIKYCLLYFQFFFNTYLNDVFISEFFVIEASNFHSIFCMLFEVFWAWNLEQLVNKQLSDFVTCSILYFLTALIMNDCMLK